MKSLKNICLVFALAVVFYACQNPDGNKTGSEYMPDMAHSVAVEANTYNYYGLNTWDKESTVELKDLAGGRLPAKGTVPRGYTSIETTQESIGTPNAIVVPANGSVPYHYEDTEEERARAIAEIISNPFPITKDGIAKGKELYEIFCSICHGTAGNFNDGIYATGIYPLAPANLINEEFTAASPGRYYHALMYGKNAMGAYKDKISYEERWQVIHYIRSLQAKELDLEYGEEENTLNKYATPRAAMAMKMSAPDMEMEMKEDEADGEEHHDGEHHSDDAHGDEH